MDTVQLMALSTDAIRARMYDLLGEQDRLVELIHDRAVLRGMAVATERERLARVRQEVNAVFAVLMTRHLVPAGLALPA